MTSMALSGLDELRRALFNLREGAQKKAAKAAINAGLGQIVKDIRSQVNGAAISPEMKTALRKIIGKRLKKDGDQYLGKAGFGVGSAGGAKGKAAKARASDGSKRGVGLSSADVHWFILGTQERHTSQPIRAPLPNAEAMKNLKGKARAAAKASAAAAGSSVLTVQYTGRVQAVLLGAIANATAASESQIVAAAGAKMSQVLMAEASAAK
jgi:hypothetical protein